MYKKLPKCLTQSQFLDCSAKRDIFIEPYSFTGFTNATTEYVDDRKLASRTSDHKISRITVYLDNSHSRCWGIQVYYKVPGKSAEVTNGPSIGLKAPMDTKHVDFELDDDEYLTVIYGASNRWISQIGFSTNKGKCLTNGVPDLDASLFKLQAPPNHHYKMLIAGSGDAFQYIGAEVRPLKVPEPVVISRNVNLRPNKFSETSNKLNLMKQSAPRLCMRNSSFMIQSRMLGNAPAANPYFKGKVHPINVRENESQLLALPTKSKITKIQVGFNNTCINLLQFSHQVESEPEVISRGIASSVVNTASVEEVFELEHDEYLIEINGTFTDDIMSFGFETSRGRKEGPYGNVNGKAFKMKAPEGCHFHVVIIGAGDSVHNVEGKVAEIPIEHLNAPKFITSPVCKVQNLLSPKVETKEQSIIKPVKVVDLNPQVAPCPSASLESMKTSFVVSVKNQSEFWKFDEKPDKFLSGKDAFIRDNCFKERR